MTCYCLNGNQRPAASSVNLLTCDNVDNVKGSLACHVTPSPTIPSVAPTAAPTTTKPTASPTVRCPKPSGSYSSSCIDCRTNTTCWLSCWCDGPIPPHQSFVDLNVCTNVRNNKGDLACDVTGSPTAPSKSPSRAPTTEAPTKSPTLNCPVPRGTHNSTCFGCRTNTTTCFMTCFCLHGTSQPLSSSVNLTRCSNVDNTAGRLTCHLTNSPTVPTRSPTIAPTTVSPTLSPTLLCPSPFGTYNSSCIDCRTNSSCFLSCWCGGIIPPIQTFVQLTLCRNIINNKGRLACYTTGAPTVPTQSPTRAPSTYSPTYSPTLNCPARLGNHSKSCVGCFINTTSCVLSCFCDTGNAKIIPSRTFHNLTDCNIVDNINGALSCRQTSSPTNFGQTISPTVPTRSPTRAPTFQTAPSAPTAMYFRASFTLQLCGINEKMFRSQQSNFEFLVSQFLNITTSQANVTGVTEFPIQQFQQQYVQVSTTVFLPTCNMMTMLTTALTDGTFLQLFQYHGWKNQIWEMSCMILVGGIGCQKYPPTTTLAPTVAYMGIWMDPIYDPPTLVAPNGEQEVYITGISGSPGSTYIVVSAFSNNHAVLPDPVVTYSYPQSFAKLTLRPRRLTSTRSIDQGTAVVTVTAVDNLMKMVTRKFTLSVSSHPVVVPVFDVIPDPAPLKESNQYAEQTIQITGIRGGSGKLSVLASVSNPFLTGNVSVSYNYPDSFAIVRYTPQVGQRGVARIYIYVLDSKFLSSSKSFTVAVVPNWVGLGPRVNVVALPPAISDDAGQQTVLVTGISGNGTLQVAASSSNVTLLNHPVVNYRSPATTALLRYSPKMGQWGDAAVTVSVADDNSRAGLFPHATMSFVVRVLGSKDHQNCVYTQWSSWQECSQICGTGVQVRLRSLLQQIDQVSDCTSFLNETRSCNVSPCVAPSFNPISDYTFHKDSGWHLVDVKNITFHKGVHLIISAKSSNENLVIDPEVVYTYPQNYASLVVYVLPGKWGTATIAVTIIEQQTYGPNITTRQFLITVPERNCSSYWGPWSECSSACGSGVRTRTEIQGCVNVYTQLRTETQSCNTFSCDTICTWGSWSLCTKSCGGGKSYRSRLPINVDITPVASCPPAVESKECNTAPCTPVVVHSCKGQCGRKTSGDMTCGCDKSCSLWGDCCNDYLMHCFSATQFSCNNRCGFPSVSNTCWCDPSCAVNNDCCEDYVASCQRQAPTSIPTVVTMRPTQVPTRHPTFQNIIPFVPPPTPFNPMLHIDPAYKSCNLRCGSQNRAAVAAEAAQLANSQFSLLAFNPPCQCDTFCSTYSDCCSDFSSKCNIAIANGMTATSCYSRCGTNRLSSSLSALASISGSNEVCHCDSSCETLKDCCADFSLICIQPKPMSVVSIAATSPSTCRNRCGTDPLQILGMCFCDDLCHRNHDCCPDRDTLCF